MMSEEEEDDCKYPEKTSCEKCDELGHCPDIDNIEWQVGKFDDFRRKLKPLADEEIVEDNNPTDNSPWPSFGGLYVSMMPKDNKREYKRELIVGELCTYVEKLFDK